MLRNCCILRTLKVLCILININLLDNFSLNHRLSQYFFLVLKQIARYVSFLRKSNFINYLNRVKNEITLKKLEIKFKKIYLLSGMFN